MSTQASYGGIGFIGELGTMPPNGRGCCGGLDFGLPPVLVDVDDTLSATQSLLIEEVNRMLGTDYEYEAMTHAHRMGRSDDPEIGRWKDAVHSFLYDTPEKTLQAMPEQDAVRAFIRLAGHVEPHIVSSRQERLHAATAQWLDSHGFADHVHRIHARPGSVRGTEFKLNVAREVGFIAAFDDTHDVCVALADVVPVVYMISKPWNKGQSIPENVVPVESFAHGVTEFLLSRGVD